MAVALEDTRRDRPALAPAGSDPARGRLLALVTSPHVHPFAFAHCVRDALLMGGSRSASPSHSPSSSLAPGTARSPRPCRRVRRDVAPRSPTGVDTSTDARAARRTRGFATASGSASRTFEVSWCARGPDDPPCRPGPRPPDGPRRSGSACRWRVAGRDRGAVVERLGHPPRLEPGEETTRAGRASRSCGRSRGRRRGDVLLIDYGSVEGPAGAGRYREHRKSRRPRGLGGPTSPPGSTSIDRDGARSDGLWRSSP